MNSRSFPSTKHSWIAAMLTILFGPFGFLYIGWRYAISGLICFSLFTILFRFILFVPFWLKYMNVIVFAFMAVFICKIWNSIVKENHPDGFALNTFPVALLAMSTMIPILAVVDTILIGSFVAVQTMTDREIVKGLIILFVATPVLAFVHYFVSGLVAAGIDKLILALWPETPLNIFPSGIRKRTHSTGTGRVVSVI